MHQFPKITDWHVIRSSVLPLRWRLRRQNFFPGGNKENSSKMEWSQVHSKAMQTAKGRTINTAPRLLWTASSCSGRLSLAHPTLSVSINKRFEVCVIINIDAVFTAQAISSEDRQRIRHRWDKLRCQIGPVINSIVSSWIQDLVQLATKLLTTKHNLLINLLSRHETLPFWPERFLKTIQVCCLLYSTILADNLCSMFYDPFTDWDEKPVINYTTKVSVLIWSG